MSPLEKNLPAKAAMPKAANKAMPNTAREAPVSKTKAPLAKAPFIKKRLEKTVKKDKKVKKDAVADSGTRRRVTDIIVTLFCVGGAVFAFILFWRDLNATLTKQNETPIAIISFKQKTAQRRFGDRVVWDLLKQESPIYSGDVIHTSDLAEATISFTSSDASLDIGENTLVRVFDTGGIKRIELSGGAVNIDAGNNGTKLVLVSSGTEIDISADSVVSANAAAVGTGGGAGLQVVKGSANIVTTEGSIEVGAGSALAMDAEGNTVAAAAVSLLTPAPSSYYITNNEESAVNFSWNTSNFAANDFVRFQIAIDQRFANIIESADVRGSLRQTVRLRPGVYWWRAFAVNSSSAEAEAPELFIANKLSIISAKTPELIAPAADSVISYRSALPTVRFQWSPDENAELYLLQAAANPQFQNPVLQTQLKGDSYTYDGFGDGVWYWQIRALYPPNWEGAASGAVNAAASSVTAMFTIVRAGTDFAPPTLTMPEDAAFVSIGNDAKNILFSWRNENDAARYTIEIADNLDFQNPLIVKTLAENSYFLDTSVTSLKSGLYFWRVNFEDGGGRASPYSAARYFNAAENVITFESVFPPDNYSVNDTRLEDVRFQWNSNLASPFNIQFSRDRSFSTLLVDETTTETALQLGRRLGRPVEGDYFWRVKSVVNDREIETAVRRFTVMQARRITLESPPSGAEIDGLSALRGQVMLNWNSGEALLNSRLLVERDGNLVFEQQNPGRTLALPPLPAGSYTWTVQAETTGGFDISPELPSNFRILPAPLLPAPVLRSPAAGYNFGAEELRVNRSISFSWNATPGANAYIFSLYREGETRPIVSTSPLRTPAYAISDLSLLDTGALVWRVEAVSVSSGGAIEQRGVSAERRFFINITVPSAPKLPDEETYGQSASG